MPAVVGGEEDDRVVIESGLFERFKQAADLCIDVAHAREVGADGGASLLGRGGERVAGHRAVACGLRDVGFIIGGRFGQRDAFEGIQVEILRRSHERQMRPVKADGEKEGLFLLTFAEPFDGRFGKDAIDELFVIAGDFLPAEAFFFASLHLHEAFPVRWEGQLAFEGRAKVPALRIVHAFESGRHAEVENFAAAGRGVAVLAEVMRHRQHAGMVRVEVVLVVCHPRGVRSHAGHHRRTRRIAVRELAEGLVENHAAFC